MSQKPANEMDKADKGYVNASWRHNRLSTSNDIDRGCMKHVVCASKTCQEYGVHLKHDVETSDKMRRHVC